MAYQTLALGLTLTIPTAGTKNWGNTLLSTTWTAISQHRHTGTGDGNQLSAAAFLPNVITGSILAKNLGLTQNPTVGTPLGTSQTIDFNLGNIQKIDLSSSTGNVTLTLSNPVQGATYTIFSIQSATLRSLIWPANVKWPQAVAPILSDTAGAIDKMVLYYDGTNFFGDWDLNYS